MFVIVEPHTFNGVFRMNKASQIANDLVMVLIRHLENKIVKIEEQLSLLTITKRKQELQTALGLKKKQLFTSLN